jgi:iron complex transport system substrate-binding protein
MKIILPITVVLMGLFQGCNQRQNQTIEGVKLIRFAQHFQLIQQKGFKELIVFSPRNHAVEARFALIPRGKKIKIHPALIPVEVPVRNMAVLSTTFVGMLDELDALPVISATTDRRYIANKWIRKELKARRILSISNENELRPESFVKKHIQLIVYSGFGQKFPNSEKLAALQIVTMQNYDWEELNPLGKAEWIKLFGALTNKNEEALAVFNQVSSNYHRLKKELKQRQAPASALMGSLANGIWYAPSGTSFLAGIAKDAGLKYIYAQTKGAASVAYTMEKICKDEQRCAVWINAEATSISDLIRSNPKFAFFQTVKSRRVYSYMHDSNYFWEKSAIHPDWLLSDFAHIGGYSNWTRLHFYRKLN